MKTDVVPVVCVCVCVSSGSVTSDRWGADMHGARISSLFSEFWCQRTFSSRTIEICNWTQAVHREDRLPYTTASPSNTPQTRKTNQSISSFSAFLYCSTDYCLERAMKMMDWFISRQSHHTCYHPHRHGGALRTARNLVVGIYVEQDLLQRELVRRRAE